MVVEEISGANWALIRSFSGGSRGGGGANVRDNTHCMADRTGRSNGVALTAGRPFVCIVFQLGAGKKISREKKPN